LEDRNQNKTESARDVVESVVSIIIQPDGTILIPRGTRKINDLVRSLLCDVSEVESFLSLTDEIDLIFGDNTYCG